METSDTKVQLVHWWDHDTGYTKTLCGFERADYVSGGIREFCVVCYELARAEAYKP